MIICKFCHKTSKANYKGYCQRCYTYFIKGKNEVFKPSQYGSLSRVTDINSKQYGMPICHICGSVYTKLQQHIWYAHGLTKPEYCRKFGIDNSINMTTTEYHKMMRDYAYKYKMDEQLKVVGKDTRFSKGHKLSNYTRSQMTMNRLKEVGKSTIHKNRGK